MKIRFLSPIFKRRKIKEYSAASFKFFEYYDSVFILIIRQMRFYILSSSCINAFARWKKSYIFSRTDTLGFPSGRHVYLEYRVIYEDHNDPSMPDVIPCSARHFVLCTSHYIFGYFGPPQYPTMVIIFRFIRLV